MSNMIEYNEIIAFHPGYYVADIIDDMGISQAEFATRMGTTGKTLSKLINGQINLSKDLAQKLAAMLGTGIELWLNLQKTYDVKVIEIDRIRAFNDQIQIMEMIDYSFFVKIANLPATRILSEKIANLCSFFMISDLRILAQPDFLVNFRSGLGAIQTKNVINSRAWIQTAMNFANTTETSSFDAEKLKQYLPDIRKMTLQDPCDFMPRLRDIFSECGVAFILLPHLKNSGINGAVKWYGSNKVVLAMNNRRAYADTFWFSLFHEIKHVLQQKTKTVFISSNYEEIQAIDCQLEIEADQFAQNYLIPPKEYKLFAPTKYTSDAEIVSFAKRIGVHPGVVAGRLQHDGIIPQNRCSKLKQKYVIVFDNSESEETNDD